MTIGQTIAKAFRDWRGSAHDHEHHHVIHDLAIPDGDVYCESCGAPVESSTKDICMDCFLASTQRLDKLDS